MEQMTLFGGLDAKAARAMDIIRLGAELSDHYYHRPLLIAYSGGKDSEVIVDLAIKSGANIEIHNNHTTVDAPETVYHIRRQFAKWREMGYKCEIEYPTYNGKRISMWELIVKKRHIADIMGEILLSGTQGVTREKRHHRYRSQAVGIFKSA